MRVELRVTMELLSDAIFGTGYSVPGGEDIAVAIDEDGYPYIPGTAVKGLLRESMANWIAWTGGNKVDVSEILGQSGWEGTAAGRRLILTPLTLEGERLAAEDCFGTRVFTALKDGAVETDTLRTAACVKRGLRFAGTMICDREDVELLTNALACIKWAGAQRSRGFGQVRFRAEQIESKVGTVTLENARCIRYRLYTETPVIITDLSRSKGSRKNREDPASSSPSAPDSGGGNSYETRGYIPGSAVRGMVASRLAGMDPVWFDEHRAALLSERTRFLDAVPNPENRVVLPSIKGFYEDKTKTAFESVILRNGEVTSGYKRAKLGSFCVLTGNTVQYWSARTGGVTRIQRHADNEDTKPFQTRHISSGQVFEGYILLDDESLAAKVAEVFSGDIWIGADRFEGYGRCSVMGVEAVEQPGWLDAYGYHCQEELGTTLYLLALSPLTMLDSLGEPCGLNEGALAKLLGVGSVAIQVCSTTISEFGSYNRTWQCREPALPMYDRGSIFKLRCDRIPQMDKLRALEWTGLGARPAEGFGQVLFLRAELFEGLCQKRAFREDTPREQVSAAAAERRARYQWIMKHSGDLHLDGLSKSQLGTIQSLCENAAANGGGTEKLEKYLQKNLNDRGARHGSRFQKISELVRETVNQPLSATLGAGCEDSKAARLKLLCQLFNYSRKGKGGDQ